MGHRRHRTAMLAGARWRGARLLLRAEVHRAFHHGALGHSGGALEQWLLWPPRVGEESKCCRVQANEVSDRKANAGSRLMKCGTRRERKKKIVDVASENTQSMYSNFVASDWLKKVGADRYSGGNIF
jgi:hypothetical protein